MSLRALLVLFAALALVVAALVALEKREEPAAEAPASERVLPAFTEAEVRSIEVEGPDGGWTIVRDGAHAWRLAAPIDAEADPRRVGELIGALQDARVDKVVSEAGEGLASFGLEPPACRTQISFLDARAPVSLRMGRTSPIGVQRYAVASGKVVLVDGALYGALSRSPATLRERRLVALEPEAIDAIELERPRGPLALRRVGDGWRLTAPLEDAASTGACLALAQAIAAMELTGPPAGPGRSELTLTVFGTGEAVPRRGFIGPKGADGRHPAWTEDRRMAGSLPEAAVAELERPAESFRDHRITSFSSPDVRWLAIERPPRGALRIERAAEGAGWTAREGEAPATTVDTTRVETLVDRLRALASSGFEAGPAAGAPSGRVVVGGAAGELARLAWGPLSPSGAGAPEVVWVTTPARPGVVFRVEASILGPMPKQVTDLAVAGKAASP